MLYVSIAKAHCTDNPFWRNDDRISSTETGQIIPSG